MICDSLNLSCYFKAILVPTRPQDGDSCEEASPSGRKRDLCDQAYVGRQKIGSDADIRERWDEQCKAQSGGSPSQPQLRALPGYTGC